MQPAGPEKGIGIISAGFLKDPTDPQWQDTTDYKNWLTRLAQQSGSLGSITGRRTALSSPFMRLLIAQLEKKLEWPMPFLEVAMPGGG